MKSLHLHHKPQKYKDRIFDYYAIAQSYRDEKNKNQKKTILNLGRLTKQEAADWRLKLKVINGDIKDIALTDELKFIDSKQYLDVAVLLRLYDTLGFEDVFSHAKTSDGLSTSDVAKILTINRCINPTAHYKICDFVSDSYLPELMGVDADKCNKDKIFRELDNIYNARKKLQKRLHELSQTYQDPDELELYFFDGTTSYFEGSSCEIAEPAKDKTTGYQNKVILICLVTDRKGYPIIWDVFSGRKNDVSEFKKTAATMAKELGIKDITLCFDRGVASESNFDFIKNKLNSKYITGLKQNQLSSVFDIEQFALKTRDKLIKKLSEPKKEEGVLKKSLPINGFYKLGKDRFYKELGVVDNRRHVVSFNIQIYEASKQTRLNNISFTECKIKELNAELSAAKKDRESKPVEDKIEALVKRYSLQNVIDYKIIPISVTLEDVSKNKVQSYKVTYEINKEELSKKEINDGILVYTTNHIDCKNGIYDVTAADIVTHYKNKYVIENAFRHIKSFIDLRPFNVYLKEHVVAHIDICMTAYFINTYIYHKLSEVGISLASFYSLIKSHSRTCTIDIGAGQLLSLLKTLPKELTSIVKLLGASPVTSKQVLKKLGIKK